MAEYPTTGQHPWGPKLKSYIDDLVVAMGSIVSATIPGEVSDAIANDPSVIEDAATAAAAKAQSDANLVKKTDPGIPTSVPDDPTYAHVFRSKVGRRMFAAFRNDATLQLFKGLRLGTDTSVQRGDATETRYLRGSIGPAVAGLAHRPLGEDVYAANGTKPQWVLDRWKSRMGLGSIPQAVAAPTVINVRPNPGAGEYAHPRLANAAITDSGPYKPYIIKVYPGNYVCNTASEMDWVLKDNVSMIGTERDGCVLTYALPDNASTADITTVSPLKLQPTAAIRNLTITARNCRYTIHSESSGVVKNYVHLIDNCTFIHYGNKDAEDWRTANPGSGVGTAAEVWKYPSVWGYGASSGGKEYFYNSKFISSSRVWYIHDRENWADGGEHIIEGCEFYSSNPVPAIDIESLGSGVETTVRFIGTALNAHYVSYNDSPWISELPANQVANHAQIKTVVGGLEPIGFRANSRGRALRIESATATAASTVRVSGTAADALMGVVYARDLGWGVKGYAFGRWDNSGILVSLNANVAVNNTMGKRLGDCTTTPKTMQVTINGGAPVTVTFNADYTAASDATVLGVINTALGASGTASLYDVVAGEEYPSFPDRENGMVNLAATTIARWSAVKRSLYGVIPMATNDPVSAFYGVTLEPIAPGRVGRILTSGRLASASQIKGVSGTLALGAAIYLSDTVAGEFSTAGTRQVMTGSGTPGWAEFS